MKRFLAMFELTVAEQRITIILLLIVVGIAVATKYRERSNDHRAVEPFVEPSPSPGTLP